MARARRPAAAPVPPVRIRHAIAGRTRLELRDWPDAGTLERLEDRLLAQGIRARAASALTRSLLLHHAPELPGEAVMSRVDAVLGGHEPRGIAEPPPATRSAPGGPPPPLAGLSATEVLERLGTTRGGLGEAEAADRLGRHHANAIPAQRGRAPGEMFRAQLATLPVALLAGSAVLSIATGGILDAIVTLGVVLANAAIGFSSESATERLIARLTRPVEHTATVLREGRPAILPETVVVPGDIILLAQGMVVPADARVIDSHTLTIDESALTGESVPVEKTERALDPVPLAVADRLNIVHRSTVVTGGAGRAAVFATGRDTELGRTGELIRSARPPRPAIEEKLERMTTGLTVGCIAVSGLVLGVGLLRGAPLVSMVKSAVALAVSAIPEGLPAVSTTTLALGARQMERERVFVRALPAVETVGSIDTICLDKTGTLTENRMAVVAAVTRRGPIEFGPGLADPAPDEPGLRELAEAVTLCNEARLTPEEGSPTELALLRFAGSIGVDTGALQRRFPAGNLHARNHRRRWMATEHRRGEDVEVFIKGAPGDLLALSSHERVEDGAVPLDAARRQTILAQNDALARRGLRVLGVARRVGAFGREGPQDLVWLGLVGLADPIRAEARQAIETFHRAGIRTLMITGDQPATALAVAEELALSRTGVIEVTEGAEIAALDDAALARVALATSVFARVDPAAKLRIVRSLQGAGRRVAMIGDGVNDGPALRMAAVGVAMGARGTDVAREVADIVIADDDLNALARAIARGRATQDNLDAAIRYILSTNLSELVVMLVESLHGRDELETPMELLWLNLVTDVLPALGLAVAEPRGDVMTRPPHPSDAPLFTRPQLAGMAIDGGGLSLAALTAHFSLLARAGAGPRTRTATFLTLALAQIAHAWVLRDRSAGDSGARRLSDRRLEGALAASLSLLALPLAIAPLGRVLGIGRVRPADLALGIALAGAAFGTAEARRVSLASAGRNGQSPAPPPG